MVGYFKPEAAMPKMGIKSNAAARDSALPALQDYVLEAASMGITITQSLLDVIGGVPGARGAFGLALGLIKTCQELHEIDEKVSELKEHIKSIMEAVLKAIEQTAGMNIPKALLNNIEELKRNLVAITEDLGKIAAQPRILIALFKSANKAKVERCMDLLKNSLAQWHVSTDVSNGIVLSNMAVQVGGMETSLNNLVRQAHTTQHAWTRQMPPKPMIFYGRDNFVDDIVKILLGNNEASKPPRICIHGPGGTGKTSTAIAVMEHPAIQTIFSEENRFWVPCVSATSPDILLHILYSNLRISRNTGDYLSDIIFELKSSAAPRLMLLDNFETPWDPIEGTKEAVEQILCSLSALSQLSILMTMRTNIPPSEQIDWIDKPLSSVDAETSKEIYCAIHPHARGKPKLEELLAELGYMPFAITLIATLGKRSKAMPATLLKDWRNSGPGILSSDESVTDSISHSIGLSMNSKTILKNAPARALLATLAMLPAGTTYDHLDWWAPELGNKKHAAISALGSVALIVDAERNDSGTSISVLPVVQSYMQHGDRIPPTVRNTVRNVCFKFVLNHKSSPGDEAFRSDVRALLSEETNIQSILLEATSAEIPRSVPDIKQVIEVLLAFSWYQHWTKPRTELIEHTLKLARKAQLRQYIAESLFCLGSTFFRTDRYDDARQCYIDAREGFRNLSNIVRASDCCFELVDLYIFMNRPPDAKQALDGMLEQRMANNKYVKARWGLARGRLCRYTGRFNEALEHLNAVKKALEGTNHRADAALCLHEISRALGMLRKWQEALDAMDQSLKLYETFGSEHQLGRALAIKNVILLKMKVPAEDVNPSLEHSLLKAQELGAPIGIAQQLEIFGEFYVQEQKTSFAIECYKAAQTQYQTMAVTYLGTNGVHRCRRNINVLEGKKLIAGSNSLDLISDFFF